MKVSYWQDAPIPREQLVMFARRLEDVIPEDHPVRLFDEILNEVDWTVWESEYHGTRGQPPIHPSILAKVLLFALLRGLRSSRKIEYTVKHSLDFIWLVSGRQIDHTTISSFRKKHTAALKKLNADIIRLAAKMGAARLSEVCLDGTRVLANANRFKTYTIEQVEQLIRENQAELEKALQETHLSDAVEDLWDDGSSADRLPAELADKKTRQQLLEQVKAQLQEMEAARKKDGIDPQKNPAQLPSTDPDSRILPNKEGGYAPNYTPLVMTETTNGFIVAAEVLTGNVEHAELVGLVDWVSAEFGTKPTTVMADGAYSTGPNLEALDQREIELLSPLPTGDPPADNPALRPDPTQPVPAEQIDHLPLKVQTQRFDKTAFVYDEERDVYFCPAGQQLSPKYHETRQQQGQAVQRTVYLCQACAGCPLANRCLGNPDGKFGRRVSRDEHETRRQRHAAKMKHDAAKARYQRRLHLAETPFAVLKVVFGLRRFLLRSLAGVRQEWNWATAAFNLKKLATIKARLRAQGVAEPQVATT